MQIGVLAHGFLRAPLGTDYLVRELEPGTTVSHLLDELGLPADLVLTVAVNGQIASHDRVLEDGD